MNNLIKFTFIVCLSQLTVACGDSPAHKNQRPEPKSVAMAFVFEGGLASTDEAQVFEKKTNFEAYWRRVICVRNHDKTLNGELSFKFENLGTPIQNTFTPKKNKPEVHRLLSARMAYNLVFENQKQFDFTSSATGLALLNQDEKELGSEELGKSFVDIFSSRQTSNSYVTRTTALFDDLFYLTSRLVKSDDEDETSRELLSICVNSREAIISQLLKK